MSAKGIFITGTDTGIGKTWVSCLLIHALVGQGKKVIGMKPVASGASMVNGQLKNEDALALMEASNVDVPYELINPYCFAPAIAPHIAADQAGVAIDISKIGDAYTQLSSMADVIIVEGVGGWSVPIDNNNDVSDLALQLGLPILLVVGMRLGCINHALLTAQSIRSKGCKLIGWIANNIDPDQESGRENIEALELRLELPLLAKISYTLTPQNTINNNVFNIQFLESLR